MKAGYSHSDLCKSLLLMGIVEISCIIVLNNVPSGPLGKILYKSGNNCSGRRKCDRVLIVLSKEQHSSFYEGWNFNSGNYLFTTDTK